MQKNISYFLHRMTLFVSLLLMVLSLASCSKSSSYKQPFRVISHKQSLRIVSHKESFRSGNKQSFRSADKKSFRSSSNKQSSLPRGLTIEDKKRMNQALKRALDLTPSGNVVSWKNPQNGNRGHITPIKTFRKGGKYCRKYITEIIVDNQKYKISNAVCKTHMGKWKKIMVK